MAPVRGSEPSFYGPPARHGPCQPDLARLTGPGPSVGPRPPAGPRPPVGPRPPAGAVPGDAARERESAGQGGGVLIEHRGHTPRVDPSAYVAPTAVLCGAVQVGPEARILFGAVLTAEDGEISVGARCVVMENALLRGRARHPCVIGDDVLVGPHAHVNGARIGDGCFLA